MEGLVGAVVREGGWWWFEFKRDATVSELPSSRHLPRQASKWQSSPAAAGCISPLPFTSVSDDMLAFTDMLLLVGSLALSLAILVPLTGTLVRFRAHYNPKGLQLDPDGGVQPHTGPVITSFFAMLVRVYKIEVRIVALL